MNDLKQVISERTRVPDRAGDEENNLDLFLISNPNIHFLLPLALISVILLSLITLRHDFLPNLDRPFAPKESSTTARLTGTPFALSTLLTLGLQAFQMILPLLLLSSPTQYFLAWIFFIPSSYKPGKNNSPKWFDSQCAKAVNNKNHYFKEWKRLQTQHLRTAFIQSRNTFSKAIKNAKSSFVQRKDRSTGDFLAYAVHVWSSALESCHESRVISLDISKAFDRIW